MPHILRLMNYNMDAVTITKCDERKKKRKDEDKKWLAPDNCRLHHRDFVLDTRADCLTLRPPTPGTGPINLPK